MSHSDRPGEAARAEGRVLVRDGAPSYEHARVRELLSDYVDGSLSAHEQDRVRQHLDECDACRAFSNSLTKLIEVTAHFPPPRLRDVAKQRILEQLKESSARS